jgi:hypothetical protein
MAGWDTLIAPSLPIQMTANTCRNQSIPTSIGIDGQMRHTYSPTLKIAPSLPILVSLDWFDTCWLSFNKWQLTHVESFYTNQYWWRYTPKCVELRHTRRIILHQTVLMEIHPKVCWIKALDKRSLLNYKHKMDFLHLTEDNNTLFKKNKILVSCKKN